jgi:hypothetical protein
MLMNYTTHNHIIISDVNTDTMNCITACLADTVIRPLYDFGKTRNLFDYVAALEIVGEWAKEFYAQYYPKIDDWDSFEISEDNIFDAMSWDDFATFWVNDRFKKYKSEFENGSSGKAFGNSSFPKIIIVIQNNTVSSVYSTIPVVYAKIDCDNNDEQVSQTYQSDRVSDNLCDLFDTDESLDVSIIEQLKHSGF